MTWPEFQIEKIYEFTVLGDLDEEKRQRLEAGVLLTGDPEPTAPARITITEGRNRQIRRMMKTQRLLVLALKRTKMGPYTLPDQLKPGEWAEVEKRV